MLNNYSFYTQSKKSIQFSFYSAAVNSNKIICTIKAKLDKGSKLIAIQKNNTLSSALSLDFLSTKKYNRYPTNYRECKILYR